MSLLLRVVESHELEDLLEFERKKLREHVPAETDRMFEEWGAKWRKESLEHFLPQGWSFLARENENTNHQAEGELVGYFIAQPFLFFEGQTQSLWVEHLQFSTLQARDELCELAVKLAKDKHMQRVYFPNTPPLSSALKSLKAMEWNPTISYLKTTKA